MSNNKHIFCFSRLAYHFLAILVCAWSIFGFGQVAHAFGFGIPILESSLGQPLKARIPILLAEGESLDATDIQLATPENYKRLQLEPPRLLDTLRLEVKQDKQGITYAYFSTSQPFDEPMLSLLLSSKIGRGIHFKFAQLLLDPVDKLVRQTGPVRPNPERIITPGVTPVQPVVAPVKDENWARIQRYGPVRTGDSLSEIAYRLRKDKRWSNKQVVLALYENNAQSFIDGDLNRLKSHGYLDVPDAEAVGKYKLAEVDARLADLYAKSARTVEQKAEKREAVPSFRGSIRLDPAVREEMSSQQGKQQPEAAQSEESQVRVDALQTALREIEAMRNDLKLSDQQTQNLEAQVVALQREVRDLKVQLNAMKQSRQVEEDEGLGWWAIIVALLLISLASAGWLWSRNRKFQFPLLPVKAGIGSEDVSEQVKENMSEQIVEGGAELAEHGSLHEASEPDSGLAAKGDSDEAVEVEPTVAEEPSIETSPEQEEDKAEFEIPQTREERVSSLEQYLRYGLYDEAGIMLETLIEKYRDDMQIHALHALYLSDTDQVDECRNVIAFIRGQVDKDGWDELCESLQPDLRSSLKAKAEQSAEPSGQDDDASEPKPEQIEEELEPISLEVEIDEGEEEGSVSEAIELLLAENSENSDESIGSDVPEEPEKVSETEEIVVSEEPLERPLEDSIEDIEEIEPDKGVVSEVEAPADNESGEAGPESEGLADIEFDLGEWQDAVDNLSVDDSEDKAEKAAPVEEDGTVDSGSPLMDFSELDLSNIDLDAIEVVEDAEEKGEEKGEKASDNKKGKKKS